MIIFFLLLTYSFVACAAEKAYTENIGFTNGGVTGFVLGTGFLITEWRWQQRLYEKISMDSLVRDENGNCGASFAYSPEQRLRARAWQQNTMIGLLSLLSGYAYPFMTPPMARALRIRSRISTAGVIEQTVVPTVVCSTMQNVLATQFPNVDPEVHNAVAVGASYVIPRFAVKLGASSERVLLHSFLLYLGGDLKNRYGDLYVLKPVLYSFELAALMIPVIQTIGTLCAKAKPGIFNLRTPRDADRKTVNFEREVYNVVVPTMICTGVGLGIGISLDLVGSTTFGKHVDQQVNEFLMPLVGEEQIDTVKGFGKQLLIVGTTIMAMKAVKYYSE